MWERPQAEFLLAHTPQLGQAMRFFDQEPYDERTEHHELNV
jgi:hypothetical protein